MADGAERATRRARPSPVVPGRARRRSTSTPTPSAPTASSSRPSSSRPAAAAGVRLLAITDHDTSPAYRELTAAGRGPARRPRAASRASRSTAVTDGATRPLRGRAAHPGLRRRPRRRRVRGAPRRASAARRRVRFERIVERLRELGHAGRRRRSSELDLDATTTSLGRPTVARLLIASGYASERRGRVRALARPRQAGLRAARGDRAGREAIPAIRAAGGLPVLAHFARGRRAHESLIRELQGVGLGGLEVYYRTFDRRHVDVGRARSPTSSAWSRPAAATTTATRGPTPRPTPRLWVPAVRRRSAARRPRPPARRRPGRAA